MCTDLDSVPKVYLQITDAAQLYISANYFSTRGEMRGNVSIKTLSFFLCTLLFGGLELQSRRIKTFKKI